MNFPLSTLIPSVLEGVRDHLKQGDADAQLVGLNERRFLVRQGTGVGDPDVTAAPEVVFPDDADPGVPVVRVTVEALDLPDEAFDYGAELLVQWRLVLDVLAANATGARTADVDAGTAEARLASWVFKLLATQKARDVLQERGICDVKPKIRGLVSGDRVFRYPVQITFWTLAVVDDEAVDGFAIESEPEGAETEADEQGE